MERLARRQAALEGKQPEAEDEDPAVKTTVEPLPKTEESANSPAMPIPGALFAGAK